MSLSAAEMGDLSFVDFFEISGVTRDNRCSKRSGDIPRYLSTEKLKMVNHCTPLRVVKICINNYNKVDNLERYFSMIREQ